MPVVMHWLPLFGSARQRPASGRRRSGAATGADLESRLDETEPLSAAHRKVNITPNIVQRTAECSGFCAALAGN